MSLTATDGVDRFLRRTMTPAQYSNVKTFEPCICDTPSRAVRFAVVTDAELLLTENPPKKLTTLLQLASIASIDIVSEAI